MTRYRLRLPGRGEYLYGDDGTLSFIADTAEEAKGYFEEWDDERPEFVHSYIAVGRVAYKRDVENGDAHEGCEPGDTTFDYCKDDGRELRAHEVRAWERGVPSVLWALTPLPPDPVNAEEIPVGTSVYHRRLGSGKTVAEPRRLSPNRVIVEVAFGFPKERCRRVCSATAVDFLPSRDWPPVRYRLYVAGEVVAEGDRSELEAMRDEKLVEHAEAWKLEHAA